MQYYIKFAIILAIAQVAFNTIIYFSREPKRIVPKALAFVPAVILTALLWMKPVTSMMLFSLSQNHFVSRGDFRFAAEMIITLISMVLAIVLSLMMAYVLTDVRLISRLVNRPLSWCGLSRPEYSSKLASEEAEAARAEAEAAANGDNGGKGRQGGFWSRLSPVHRPSHRPRKALTIRRAAKIVILQLYYLGQLPIVFGLVAPIVVYVSLRIWNFWVAIDLIVGGALTLVVLFIMFGRCCMRDPYAWDG
jgi:hypothetical protein